MRSLRITLCLVTLAATALLAGCGSSGSSGVSAGTYVKSICQAVGPFESDVLTRSNALNTTQVKSPAQGKLELQSFLAAISRDTDTALAKLKAAGTPNVKNGAEISKAIVGAFAALQNAMHRATAQANGLSTTSATQFKAGAEALSTNVRNSMTSIGQNLQSNTVKSRELQQAAAKEPACKSIS